MRASLKINENTNVQKERPSTKVRKCKRWILYSINLYTDTIYIYVKIIQELLETFLHDISHIITIWRVQLYIFISSICFHA